MLCIYIYIKHKGGARIKLDALIVSQNYRTVWVFDDGYSRLCTLRESRDAIRFTTKHVLDFVLSSCSSLYVFVLVLYTNIIGCSGFSEEVQAVYA